jgi:hypothetical protein
MYDKDIACHFLKQVQHNVEISTRHTKIHD